MGQNCQSFNRCHSLMMVIWRKLLKTFYLNVICLSIKIPHSNWRICQPLFHYTILFTVGKRFDYNYSEPNTLYRSSQYFISLFSRLITKHLIKALCLWTVHVIELVEQITCCCWLETYTWNLHVLEACIFSYFTVKPLINGCARIDDFHQPATADRSLTYRAKHRSTHCITFASWLILFLAFYYSL